MRYPAVIFDLDGTLLDTLADLADAMNAVLAGAGRAPQPLQAYRYFVGDGMEMLVRRATGLLQGEDALVEQFVAAMRAEYARRWERQTRPYAGVPELLDALSERGVAMAVLSNKPEPLTRLAVDRLLGRWEFRAVIGARAGAPRKPDPDGAWQIAAGFGLPPARIAYLGDTDTDMRTATAAGMLPVGAAWGFRPAAELRRAGAAHVIATPLELLPLLDGSPPMSSPQTMEESP